MTVSAIQAASGYYTPASASGSVSVAAALVALRANPRARVSISDTADAISAQFDALARVTNNITGLAVSDAQAEPPGVIELSAAQYLRQSTRLLTRLADGATVSVQGLSASRAATVQTDARVSRFTVLDNSTELASRLSVLQGLDKLGEIQVSTPATAMAMTASTYESVQAAMAKITTGGVGVALSAATADQAVAVRTDTRVRSVAVLDSAAGIVEELDGLTALGSRLKSVRSSSDNVLQVSSQQVQRHALVIGKLYRAHQLAVQGATLTESAALAANRRVVSIDVQDTSANVSANLSQLARLGSDLNRIHLTDAASEAGAQLVMSTREYDVHAAVLARIDADDAYTVAVTGASVVEAQTLADDARVARIGVTDTAAAISGGLGALQSIAKLDRISQTGRAQAITLTAAQLAAPNVLGKIDGQYTLSVTQVQAAQALNLAANPRVASVSVSDTGAAVLGQLDNLAMLGGRLSRITLQDAATPLGLSAARWSTHIGTLAKIQGGYSVALSGVSAARAAALADDSRVRSIAVSDSAAALSARLDDLHELGATLTGITQTDAASGAAVRVLGRQYAEQSSTLAKLGNTVALEVQDASVSQAAALAADSRVQRVAVADSSPNIATGLSSLQDAIVANAGRSWSIRQVGTPTVMSMSVAQYTRNSAALQAITGPTLLSVTGVTAAAATGVAQDRRVVSLAVADTAAQLSDAQTLTSLAGLGSRLSRIEQTQPASSLNLTSADWLRFRSTLDKTVGGVRVQLSQVQVDQVPALAADWRVQSLAVRDTAAQIGSRLETLQAVGPLLSTIARSDADAVAITAAQWRGSPAALAKLEAGTTLAVRDATVDEAQTLTGADHAAITSVRVRDTAARVSAAMAELGANAKLASVTLSDPSTPLAMTHTAYQASSALLGRFEGGLRLNVSGVAAADVAGVADDSRVVAMAVTGTAAAVVAQLDDLSAAGRRVASITLAGDGAITVDHAQWAAHQATLARITSRWSATVTDVNAARAASVAAAPTVTGVQVRDSAAQVARHLDALQAVGPALSAITLTDEATPTLSVSASQLGTAASALGKLPAGGFQLSVTGASVAQALALSEDDRVSAVAVSDGSARIAASLDALAALPALASIRQTGTPQPLSLSAQAYASHTATLAKIADPYTLNLSGVAVDDAATVQADALVAGFSLSGTTSAIGAAIGSLEGMGKLQSLHLSEDDAPISVSLATFDNLDRTLGLLREAGGSGYRLRVSGVGLDRLDEMAQRPDLDGLGVSAGSAAVSEAWPELLALGDRLTAISLSDTAVPVALTHDQWLHQAAPVSRIGGDFSLAITAVPASAAATVAAGARVSAVSVTDVGSALSAHFDELAALGSGLTEVLVSDGADIVITQAQAESAEGIALLGKIMGEHEVVVQG